MEIGKDYTIILEDERKDFVEPRITQGTFVRENRNYVTLEDDDGKLLYIPWGKIFYIVSRN